MAIELTGPNLKAKYREPKPKGRNRADYAGNSGKSRHKHTSHPMYFGVRRKVIQGKTR